MIYVVCIGLGLVPVDREKSDERVLVAAFAPIDSPIETTIEIVVQDATAYTVGERYALTLAPDTEEADG